MDQKRLFLAIAISVAILLGFQVLIAPHLPQPPKPPAQVADTQTTGRRRPRRAPLRPRRQRRDGRCPRRSRGSRSRRIDCAARSACWARGWTIWCSPTIARPWQPNSPNVRLLEPRSEPQPYYVQYGWSAAPGEQVKLPDNDTVWAGSGGTLSAGHPVTLSWDNGAGLTFQITMSVDDDYMFAVQQSVKNATGAPVKLFPWARIRRDYTPVVAGYYILFEGLLGVVDGKLQESTYSNTKSEGEKKNGIAYEATATGGWAGITDKYWLAALVPDQSIASTVNFRHITENGDHYQVDYVTKEPQTIAANGDASLTSRAFAGAKIVGLLDRYAGRGPYS